MPNSPTSPVSSAGHLPMLDRLLPSWIVRWLSRGRASSSGCLADPAMVPSDPASSAVIVLPDGPQPHSQSSSSNAAASSRTSSSPSSGKRPSLREQLSAANLYRRLSQAFTPSSYRSPPTTPCSPEPEPASSALQVPPSSSSTDGTDPDPPADSLASQPTATTSEVSALSTDAKDAIIHTSTACIGVADPKTEMWAEAVAEWQLKTGLDLADPDAISLRSKEAVMSYIAKMEEEENGSEKGEWETLRERVDPLAHILEKLCNPIGDTISAAFPPSNIIFAAVGLIVSAYTRTREDFAQIGDAFYEMRFHLQVVETVADSHPCDVLRTACVLLLIKVLSVLGVIAEMRREGYLRQWLSRISSQTRPLSEALQNLRLLATNQQQVVAAITLNKVTQLMESIASDKVSQEWICGCLVDVLRAIREGHDLGSLTQAEVNAHRTALRRMELVLYDQSEKLRKIEMSAECEQIKGWLKYVDPSYRLRKLLDDRTEGTGSWFLDGDEFAALKEGKSKAVLLSGKAGSGKSTIIAAAVEALRAYHACDPHSLVLVHVFDSTNATSGQRDLHALLSTLLCQLALKNSHCASIISEAHQKIVANGLPTKARMEGLFMETLRATSLHITVVVDAMDESSDEEDIVSFIRRLEAMSDIIVLASRRPVIGSTAVFGVVISMDNHVKNNDIGLFLDLAMAQGSNLGRMQSGREGMRAELLAGAEGNFRWAALVTQELKEVSGIPTMVLRRLRSLPSSLRALYQQRLDSIHHDARDGVRRLLLWLVRSEVPLRLNDFADLMAFDYSHETPIYHASHRPLPEAVIEMVGSMLITVDQGVVRLAHASVRDFLLGLPSQSPFFICKDTDYTLMTRTVLAYLAAMDQMDSLDPNSPLTYTWVYYMRKMGSKSYNDLLKEAISVVSKVSTHPIGMEVVNKSLLTAAEVDHCQLVAALIDDGGVDIEYMDIDGRTSLHIAAGNGHLGVASLLLDRGAAANTQDNQRFTPLMVAAFFSQEDVACLLLDKGACLEDCTEDNWTSLHFAAHEGHLGIASLLLEHGASVDARTNKQDTPLMTAACNSREDIVRLLLDKGAQVEDHNELDMTSLHFAAEKGHLGIARVLLDMGVHVEGCDANGNTSLHGATRNGHLDIVTKLLERGADVNAINNIRHTPLHNAAQNGHAETAKLLVDRGAVLEARNAGGWAPLYLAVRFCQESTTALLLSLGSDLRTRADDGTTLLDAAGRGLSLPGDTERHMRVRELLMQAGCTEETGRIPLINWVLPESARAASS